MPYVSEAAEAGSHESGVGTAGEEHGCIFCKILGSPEPEEATYVVWRGRGCAALLNAYPYASGHVLVMPVRHVGELGDLSGEESAGLWSAILDTVAALGEAYRPEGFNVGFNLGAAAGAGIPAHLHAHVVPRWVGDTNFMTSLAEARVLPESLGVTWERVRAAWHASPS